MKNMVITYIFFILHFCKIYAQPDGPLNPSSNGSDNSIGTLAWSNGSSVYTSDDSRASVDLNFNGDVSNYLTVTNFGFSIPSTAVVDGIVVEIERSDDGGDGNVKDNSVKIIKGGAIVGTDLATGMNWSSIDTYKTYGGAIILWGTTWLYSDINSSNFGVAISVKRTSGGANNKARIDHVRITVYYTVTLPVELLYFKGEAGKEGTLIEWVTASETNSDYFLVQRSLDLIHFENVAKIKAKGNSSVQNIYFTIDSVLALQSLYYRLVQYDYNGNYKIEQIIEVNPLRGSDIIRIYPNPAISFVTVETQMSVNSIHITLCDLIGRIYYETEEYKDSKQKYTFLIALPPVKRGTSCVLTVFFDNHKYSELIVVQ